MTPAECPQQGKTRHEGARARRERRRRAEARLRLMLLRDAQLLTSHRGGPVAEPMSGAGMEIRDSVRKNHEMFVDVRANFESQLQQAEKKLEELRLGIEERFRDAELLRVELENETARAKRDEMALALACRKAVQNSELLPILAVGVMRFLRKDFSHDLWCNKFSAERFVYHIRTIFRERCHDKDKYDEAELSMPKYEDFR